MDEIIFRDTLSHGVYCRRMGELCMLLVFVSIALCE